MWRRTLQFIMDRRPTKAYVVDGHGLLFYRSHLFTVRGWVVYLHHYLQGDPDERGLHDHPARNWSLVLSGGYVEHRIVGYNRDGPVYEAKERNPGSIRYVSERVFHCLEIEPFMPSSWSMFASKYVPDKAWGFMDKLAAPYKPQDLDNASAMLYREAGPGIDDDPWWTSAPRGKEVCSDHSTPANTGERRAESEGAAVRTVFGGTGIDRTGIQRRTGGTVRQES